MWKLILALLLSCCLSQIVSEQHVLDSLNNDETYAVDGYEDVPTDNLDALHTFIKIIIEQTYPALQEWSLADIKEKFDNTTDQTLYLYTYLDVVVDADNQTNVVNMSSVPVISHDNGNIYTIFDGYSAVASYAAPKRPTPRPSLVGGFSPRDANNLTATELRVKDFVLKNVPGLSEWTLVSVKTQIVAGQNICYTFESPDSNGTLDFCVFSQPWNNNYLELTLPDGSTIRSGGSVNVDSTDAAQPSSTPSTNSTTSTNNTTADPTNAPVENSPADVPSVGSGPSGRRLQVQK